MKKQKSKIMIILMFLFQFSLQIFNSGENWAILACGSSGYVNYRHQADVFHVYQSLIKRGFSKNHIILFAFDDIAYNPKNPFPGEIYNRPDGPNVYEGVIIDYTYNDVNPETYLSVLKGDTQKGKLEKVLNSTENDNIFMYFSDHGVAGAIVFPNNKFLYADELEEAFKVMKSKKMYKNIIFYLESCYSGSMFNNINPDLNVYSITAASPSEKSLATYCYPQDLVKGHEMHTCLSNEFTSNWLDDSDNRLIFNKNTFNKFMNNINDEYTSHEQYIYVKDLTKNSNVQEYGNLLIGDLPITHFQSSNDSYNDNNNDNNHNKDKENEKDNKEATEEEDDYYEEIKRRIIEFDLDDDDNNNNYLNSHKNEESDLDDEEFDDISIYDLANYNPENESHDYIYYIIKRNEYMNKIKKNTDKNNTNEEYGTLRGKSKKKKIIKNTKYNLVSSYVKLFYLELEINEAKNDYQKYLDYKIEITETERTKNLFELLKLKLNIPDKIDISQKIDYKCLRYSIQLFKDECGINERDLEYLSLFSFECSKKNFNTLIIRDSIIELCKDKKDGLI